MTACRKADDFREACEHGLLEARTDPRNLLRQHVISALRDTPGVSRMHVTHSSNPGLLSRPSFTIAVHGWSPSLHELRMVHTITADPDPDDAQWVRSILPEVSSVIGRLSSRADAARRHGFDRPRSWEGNWPEVSHLRIDSSLHAMIVEAGHSCISGARSTVRRLHGRNANHACHVHLSDNDRTIVERQSDDPTQPALRTVGWRVDSGRLGDGLPSYNGSVLSMSAPALPETAIAALHGRRLDDLARVHPALDHRIIRAIHVDTLGGDEWLYTVVFEHDFVPLAEVPMDASPR